MHLSPHRVIVGVFFVGTWLTLVPAAQATGATAQSAGAVGEESAATGAAQPAGFVGAETCLTCHEDEGQGIADSAHGRALDPRSPAAANGCESCHGPGQAHVDAGGDASQILTFSAMTPVEVSETCVTCHNREEHAEWEGSAHEGRDVSCISCHSVHEPKSQDAQLVKATQAETCAQCHTDKQAKLQRSGHMPVREGKMECSSCHNPHGSQNVKLLAAGMSVNESCLSCHTEKRGPFLYEHAPVAESCVSCHDPHGSNNERMLVSKQPMLCQRCHVHSRHPATVYDATQVLVAKSSRAVGRSCANCHSMVHGSNHPSGKFFTR